MKKPTGKGKWIALVVIVVIVLALAVRWMGREQPTQEHQPGSISTEEHSSQEQETTEDEVSMVELTVDEWKDILLQALDCEGAEADLTVSSDGVMTLSGDLPKSTISNWLESGNVELSSMYQTIFDMLPDTVPMTLKGTIVCEDGNLKLSGNELYVSKIELSKDMLSDNVWEQINTNLNNEVHTRIPQVNTIRFEEETVVLEK
ncbi:MAG: hypothetical protein ACI4PM_08370 [Butyricicoccus sp.]